MIGLKINLNSFRWCMVCSFLNHENILITGIPRQCDSRLCSFPSMGLLAGKNRGFDTALINLSFLC